MTLLLVFHLQGQEVGHDVSPLLANRLLPAGLSPPPHTDSVRWLNKSEQRHLSYTGRPHFCFKEGKSYNFVLLSKSAAQGSDTI
jgi:hypothetical protein